MIYDLLSTQSGLKIVGGLKYPLRRYERFISITSAQLADVFNDPHAPAPRPCYSNYTLVRRIIKSVEQRVRPRLEKVSESGLSETVREMISCRMGVAWLPEPMATEELVNQQIIYYRPGNTDLVCEILVVVWMNLGDQRAVVQGYWEKLLRPWPTRRLSP